MKRYMQVVAGLCVVLCCATVMVQSADTDQTIDAQRKAFIDAFERNGLNTTPGDAMMLRILIEASGCKRGVEVGTANGYGAINMGIAFERTGGRLDTVEIEADRVKASRKYLKELSLDDVVTCHEGDALKVLPTLKGDVDFLFIDAVKSDYLKYFKILEPQLVKGAVIVADNCVKSEKAMKDYLDYVQNSPDYDTVIIRASMEKGDGMAISYKIK